MKADSESSAWKWRRPTAWGLAILCSLSIVEGILVYLSFFPGSSDFNDSGMMDLASFVIGSLLLICAAILLTERTSP